ncbi:MAG: bifunctional folylpolyglutamate synthase/dihydrofolate synthase [Chloroflexi bacterium]|nr:bifunctional folylpolyglutamate synthase/dihydrofolate synthase [Chloroflexota bacterium]
MTAHETGSPSISPREREALAWLFRFSDWERGVGWSRDAAPEEVWKLGRTRGLLDLAGAPDRALRIVHVAGTKGKGSTVAYLEAVVLAAGWRTAVYTQPHLHEYRERIRIDGQPVDPERFADGVDRLRVLVGRFAALHPEAGAPTTFELTTVLAALLGAEAGVDLMIAEVGLGGRLDATNALDTDVAVIARIGLDHRQILGRTLAEIAGEKSAIVRPGQPVLSVRQRPSAQAVVERQCERVGAHLRTVSPLRIVLADDGSEQVVGRLASGKRFRTRPGLAQLLEGIGEHQRQNAALAVAAADALTDRGLPLTARAVEQGLAAAWLPARLELVRLRPRVLIDAAHNIDSARALAEELGHWQTRPVWLVLGILRDKDAPPILRELLPLADGVIVVTPTSPRALPAEHLGAACALIGDLPVKRSSSVAAGIAQARKLAGPDGAVVVTGSFATASEARASLGLAGVVTGAARQAWLRAGGLESEP